MPDGQSLRSRPTLTDLPFVAGALLGAGAAVAGLVATAVLATEDAPVRAGANVSVGDVGATSVDVLLWIFFEAHFVGIERSDAASTESISLLGGSQAPELIYTVIPVVFLIVAGRLLVKRHSASTTTDALVGGVLAVGYLPVLVGLQAVATASTGAVTVAPELRSTVLVAGVAFPVVCGTLGGVIAVRETNGEQAKQNAQKVNRR